MSGLLDFLKRAAGGLRDKMAEPAYNPTQPHDSQRNSGRIMDALGMSMPANSTANVGLKTLYGAMKPGAAAARLAEQRAFPAMAQAERTAPLFEANAANGMAVQAGQRMSPLAGSPIPGAAPTSLREAFLAAMKEGR